MRIYFFTLILSLLTGLLPSGLANAQVAPDKINKDKLAESIEAVLKVRQPVKWLKKPITAKLKKSLKGIFKIKQSLADTLYVGEVQTDDGLRYLIPDTAPSKSRKFSYVLYLTPEKEIVDVDVLQYRENYGYQIDYSFFRKQFRHKKNPKSVRFGRSIQNISGATISARSLTYSVHDLLALIQKVTLK